ncbi:MAG: PspC domain-containing protein [Spirochaetota bacterium]
MKQLERNLDKKLIAGVCAGIADSTSIDVTVVRIIFVVFALSVGFGFLLYVVLWVIMPIAAAGSVTGASAPKKAKANANEPPPSAAGKGKSILGISLIGAGIVVILSVFLHSFIPLLGIALIALGVILITQIGMKR